VLLPDGQYLLKLIENVNKLVPYMAIRQILRVGNAATMINGMLKIFLAKLSVTSVTNWAGLSKKYGYWNEFASKVYDSHYYPSEFA
jgi:hypothetical protein